MGAPENKSLALNAPRNALPLRSRLLLASAAVQLVMMALLIYNSISVMDEKLIERTRIHLEEQKQLLSAALAVPVANADRAKAHEVLERARREQGIAYLVLSDRKGRVIATSGWDKRTPLPPREMLLTARGADDVFHTETEVRIEARERTGDIHKTAQRVYSQMGCKSMVVTRGKNGCICE